MCKNVCVCLYVCASYFIGSVLHLAVVGSAGDMANKSRFLGMGVNLQGCRCGESGRAVERQVQWYTNDAKTLGHNSKTLVFHGFSGAKSEDIWRCFATEKLMKVENRLTAPQVRSLSRSHHEYTPQRMAQLGTSAPIWVKLAFSLAIKALPTKCPLPKESWSSDFSYILRPIYCNWLNHSRFRSFKLQWICRESGRPISPSRHHVLKSALTSAQVETDLLYHHGLQWLW